MAKNNIEFILGDIRNDIPEGPFDNVIWDAAIEHFTEEEIRNNHDRMKRTVQEISRKPALDPKAWARKIVNDFEKGKYKSEIGLKFAREALRLK